MAISDLFTRLQQPGLAGAPVEPLNGVATVPQHTIGEDLDRQVKLMLDGMAPGTHSAVLNVNTKKGVNLVFASKVNDKLTATLWVGKSGWDLPVNQGWEGDVSVRASWGK